MKNAHGTIMTNVSMSADAVSSIIPCSQRAGITIDATWSGTAVGSIMLQMSTEPDLDDVLHGSNVSATSFRDYVDTDFDILAGDGSMLWIEPYPFALWLRVIYRSTSGDGVLNCRYNGKS